ADPVQGARLRSLRDQYRPAADVSGTLRLVPAASGTRFALAVEGLDHFSADLYDCRLALRDVTGRIEVDDDAVRLDQLRASLDFNDVPAGRVEADGRLALTEGHIESLLLSMSDGRFESPLVLAIARRLRPRIAETLDSLMLRGVFTLSAEVNGPANARTIAGRLEPQSLALRRNEQELRFDHVSGVIRFGPAGGEVANLLARAADWTVSADGTWISDPSLDVDLRFGFESQGLPSDLLAALPADAADAFHAVRLDLTGPLTLHDTRLRTIDDGASLRLSAHAEAGEASLDVGLPVNFERASAAIDVVWTLDESAPPSVSADLMIPRFSASRAALSQGRVLIRSGDRAGAYQLEALAANMHGGMITAAASFTPAPTAEPRTSYTAELQAARIDFASLLNDLHDPESPEPFVPDVPGSRGEIDASISIAGTLGLAEGRRGRGSARISGGEVIALPGAMPMLRLSNLQPPLGEPLESATASFYLSGDTLTFESLQASSESLVIVGTGTITLPEAELNLEFNSAGRGTIPILDDLLRGLRNEIMTTIVTGTIASPVYRLEAFPGTQRMLGAIFHGRRKELPPAERGVQDQEMK
ncbi:MAG: hypothetical protein JNK58_05530, partial [Phycisphaerae bacterium]|nr:hypothetical protein [Phycisphaerae bacterium]